MGNSVSEVTYNSLMLRRRDTKRELFRVGAGLNMFWIFYFGKGSVNGMFQYASISIVNIAISYI